MTKSETRNLSADRQDPKKLLNNMCHPEAPVGAEGSVANATSDIRRRFFAPLRMTFNSSFGFNKLNKKAFTLIEIILAIFILEIGLLGIAGFYAYSFQISKVARNQTIAANLAQGVLDEQIAINYEDIDTVDRTVYSADPAFANFDKEVTVTCIDADLADLACNNPAAHMKKIVVTIYWQEADGEENFQTATIKAEH